MTIDSKTYRVPPDKKVDLSEWPTTVAPYSKSKLRVSAHATGIPAGAGVPSQRHRHSVARVPDGDCAIRLSRAGGDRVPSWRRCDWPRALGAASRAARGGSAAVAARGGPGFAGRSAVPHTLGHRHAGEAPGPIGCRADPVHRLGHVAKCVPGARIAGTGDLLRAPRAQLCHGAGDDA